MALPGQLEPGLLPTEVEFLATSTEHVYVVPLVRIDRVRLLSGVYGPFRPPTQARVPLWLALNLKKRRKCRIICPEWLHIDNLRALLRTEQSNVAFASISSPFYQSIAKVLLESAADDVPSADDVREALKSLREARQSKILAGLEMINADHLEMTDISRDEITELRHFFTDAFQHLRALQRAAHEPDGPTEAGIAGGTLASMGSSEADASAGASRDTAGADDSMAIGGLRSIRSIPLRSMELDAANFDQTKSIKPGLASDRSDSMFVAHQSLNVSSDHERATSVRSDMNAEEGESQRQDSINQNSMDLF